MLEDRFIEHEKVSRYPIDLQPAQEIIFETIMAEDLKYSGEMELISQFKDEEGVVHATYQGKLYVEFDEFKK